MRRMKNAAAKLMLLTGNSDLRRLRQRILDAEGFEVVAPENASAAADRIQAERFDIAIVCHSVTATEAAMLVRMFQTANPGGRVIAITLLGTMPDGFPADRAVSGIEGPAALLEAVRELSVKGRKGGGAG